MGPRRQDLRTAHGRHNGGRDASTQGFAAEQLEEARGTGLAEGANKKRCMACVGMGSNKQSLRRASDVALATGAA